MFPIGDGTSDVIVAATIADPYLLLFFEDGTIKVMQGDAKTKGVTLVELPAAVNVCNICVFADKLCLLVVFDLMDMTLLLGIFIFRNFLMSKLI